MPADERLVSKVRRLAGDKRLLERRLRHAEAELECVEVLLLEALDIIRELGGYGPPTRGS